MNTKGIAGLLLAAGFAVTIAACTSDGNSTTTVKEQVTSKAVVKVDGKNQYRLYVAKNTVTATPTATPSGGTAAPYPWVVVNRALYNATSKGDYYEEDRAGTVTVHTSVNDDSGKTIDSSGSVDSGTSGHVGGADGEGHGGGVGDAGGGGDGGGR